MHKVRDPTTAMFLPSLHPLSPSFLLKLRPDCLIPAEISQEITIPDRGRKWQAKTTRPNDSKLKTDKRLMGKKEHHL